MTNQEVLNIMCERCSVHDVCQGTGCTPRAMMQELVDKATPRMPKYTDGNWHEKSINVCPNCGVYPLRPMEPYCSNCGQALNWEAK